MIKAKCIKCGKQLKEKGAILSGVPYIEIRGPACFPQEVSDKNHLCVSCYKLIIDFIDNDYLFPT